MPKSRIPTEPEKAKSELLQGLIDVRSRILEAASDLPLGKQNEAFLGFWTIKDLLAHLIGWDDTNLEAAKSILAGALPAFYSSHDRDWASYNAQLVAKYKKDDLRELIDSTRISHRQLIAFLESIPASDFFEDKGVRARRYKVTIGRLMHVEMQDEGKHLAQIEALARPSERS
jgi:hypothetical protein